VWSLCQAALSSLSSTASANHLEPKN